MRLVAGAASVRRTVLAAEAKKEPGTVGPAEDQTVMGTSVIGNEA